MRSILFFSSLALLFSCSYKNPNITSNDLLPGDVLVTTNPIDQNTQSILNYVGVDVMSQYQVEFNSEKSHYFKFLAIIDLPKNENGGHSSNSAELASLQFFDQCFFYKKEEEGLHKEKLNFDFSVDHRMNEILNNDSLYFATTGRNFNAVELPIRISSHPIIEENQYVVSDDYPISLFRASVKNKEADSETMSYLYFGMMAYDCDIKYDFESYFKSPSFLTYAMFSKPEDYNSEVYRDLLKMDNYLVSEE